MVNCIVSNNRCDICYDLTGDSIINIVDIITLINIILDNNRSPNF